jgi:hypothetical protein
MKIKSEKDFWSGLMFVATGVAFGVGATNYSLGESARPGPGYFPLGLSIVLTVLGAIVLFKSLTIETEGGDPIGTVAWRPLIVIVLAIMVFGIALPRLGMVITLPILGAVRVRPQPDDPRLARVHRRLTRTKKR